MRVLVLGGTGSIGAPVLSEIVARGHEVIALARSETAARKLADLGAQPLPGDIGEPGRWLPALPALHAVVHMACDFASAMAEIERRLLDALLPYLARSSGRSKFIYTGGCWLYGATHGKLVTETAPFQPLPAFAWMVPHLQRVLAADGIDPIVIHPAMVYEAGGGVFHRFVTDARAKRPTEIAGSEQVRWPLVHRQDLARLYALAMESKAARTSFIGASIDGLAVGAIARAFAKRFGAPEAVVVSADAVAAELGEWARGRALDQLLSGAKAIRELGWKPEHTDPISEIAAI